MELVTLMSLLPCFNNYPFTANPVSCLFPSCLHLCYSEANPRPIISSMNISEGILQR